MNPPTNASTPHRPGEGGAVGGYARQRDGDAVTIEDMVADLRAVGQIDAALDECTPLRGSYSTVAAVGRAGRPVLVVKANAPGMIAAEAAFLRAYVQVPLLPRLQYVDSGCRYLAYRYKQGRVSFPPGTKAAALLALVDGLFNRYVRVERGRGWGRSEDALTWDEYLRDRVAGARYRLQGRLPAADHAVVAGLLDRPWRRRLAAAPVYLLHGDCGFHNLLFEGAALTGVIDPTPLFGPPIYDLVYAFCSSPDDLTRETLQLAAARLRGWVPPTPAALWEEAVVGLYCRMGSCLLHHPHDFLAFLEAWRRWRVLGP